MTVFVFPKEDSFLWIAESIIIETDNNYKQDWKQPLLPPSLSTTQPTHVPTVHEPSAVSSNEEVKYMPNQELCISTTFGSTSQMMWLVQVHARWFYQSVYVSAATSMVLFQSTTLTVFQKENNLIWSTLSTIHMKFYKLYSNLVQKQYRGHDVELRDHTHWYSNARVSVLQEYQ